MIEQLVFTEMPRIEEEMVDTLFGHEDRHAFRHDIARCKVSERMTADHHPVTCRVDKERSFTAHRLRHEQLLTFGPGSGPEDCRMKLDEFDIGERGAGPHRHGHSVPGRDRWVGRTRIKLPESAACDHHGPGPDYTCAVAALVLLVRNPDPGYL